MTSSKEEQMTLDLATRIIQSESVERTAKRIVELYDVIASLESETIRLKAELDRAKEDKYDIR